MWTTGCCQLLAARDKWACVAVGVRDNATEVLVGVGIDHTGYGWSLLGPLVVIVQVTVRVNGEFQQVMVVFGVSVLAVLGGSITRALAKLDQRVFETVCQLPIPVVTVFKPVGVAAARLPIGERCLVGIPLGLALTKDECFPIVGALPGLKHWRHQ